MYIGIDFGLKRCGIAVTDTESIIASPLQMVPSEKLLSWLKEFAAKHSIAGFVLVYPLNLDGSKTHVSDNVTLLKEVIEKEFLKQHDLMIISLESWKKLVDSQSDWLSDIPSVLIVKP